MARTRSTSTTVLLLGATAVLVSSCESEGSVRLRRVTTEGGIDADLSEAAAPIVRDSAVIRDSAPQCDAVHFPGSTDAAGPTRSDSAGSIAANDAGAPPTDCLAPCVWELVKNCLPPGPCVSQTIEPRSPFYSYSALMCVAGTGWAGTQDTPSSLRTSNSSVSVYVDDAFCYGFSISQMSGVTGLNALWWTGPRGYHGAAIGGPTGGGIPGFIARTRWGPVACGTVEAFLANPECVQGGRCVDGGGVTFYDVDPDQPHCAPWRSVAYAAYGRFSCTPGCCP